MESTTILQSLGLGIVQGLTEYLPVSSSAHLLLLPRFFSFQDPGLAFDVFLHTGTLAATLAYFRQDWIALFRNPKPLLGPLIVGTVPALAVGAVLHHAIELHLRGSAIVAVALFVGGGVLWAADRFQTQSRELSTITLRDAGIIGALQCLALVPGFSRSGSTLLAGRFVGLSREAAARFSFLLSAPVTFAAIVFELRKVSEFAASSQNGALTLIVGAVAAGVFGWLAIGGLLRWLKTAGFAVFWIYRTVLAVLILTLLP